MAQKFLSYEQQINLIIKKGLNVCNIEYAKSVLKQVGYFALISGYKDLFKNPTTNKYKDNTRFEDIVVLYKFDENLRELFLKYLLKVERSIRSLISYYFTEKFGESQTFYLDISNFKMTNKNATGVNRLVSELGRLANNKSDYDYINYHRDKYNNVPLWVLVNGLTFGTLSKFYEYSTDDLKCKISKNFDFIKEKDLQTILNVITKFRNVCAHNERLFSYKTKNHIPDLNLHSRLNIPKKGTVYKYGKQDLFAVVLSLRYLLRKDDFITFKRSLSKIIKLYAKQTNTINETELLEQMGFPGNWKKVTEFRNI